MLQMLLRVLLLSLLLLWVLLLRLRLLLSPALGLAHVLRCLRLQLLTWGPC